MRKLRWTALGFTLILVVSLFASTAAALPNPYYDVHVVVTGNGDAWTNVSRAHAGDTVSITVRADAGYELEDITVVPGESLWEVSWDEDSSWFEPSRWFDDEDWSAPDLGSDDTIKVNRWNRFTMPHNDVTVWVRFSDDGCDGSWPGCPSYRFTDVEADAWYHEAVDYAVSCGFLDGVSKTSFDPDGAVTRAMTWLVLGRVSGNRDLEDCSPWYADAQAWAKNHRRQEPHRRSHPAGAYHHALPLVRQPQGFRLAGRLSRRGPRRLLGEGRHGLGPAGGSGGHRQFDLGSRPRHHTRRAGRRSPAAQQSVNIKGRTHIDRGFGFFYVSASSHRPPLR